LNPKGEEVQDLLKRALDKANGTEAQDKIQTIKKSGEHFYWYYKEMVHHFQL